mmetsp:Transcript_9543/g.24372  ORF Transcript_9543/g.24372 Transcript_9543/m.24372 type:complete len:238 (-) Transcript_9543:360-1073(-)
MAWFWCCSMSTRRRRRSRSPRARLPASLDSLILLRNPLASSASSSGRCICSFIASISSAPLETMVACGMGLSSSACVMPRLARLASKASIPSNTSSVAMLRTRLMVSSALLYCDSMNFHSCCSRCTLLVSLRACCSQPLVAHSSLNRLFRRIFSKVTCRCLSLCSATRSSSSLSNCTAKVACSTASCSNFATTFSIRLSLAFPEIARRRFSKKLQSWASRLGLGIRVMRVTACLVVP